MTEKFKFIVPGRPEYISTIRLAVGSVAGAAGFDVEEIEDIETAAGEACHLVSCHEMTGYAREYSVECETEPGKITLVLVNDSKDVLEKTNKKCLDCPNEGELGKLLIRTLMDSVEVVCDEDKKIITMVKTKK